MKYVVYNMGSYKLHTIKTDRFKTNFISINFKRKAEKNEITIRNLLCEILFYCSLKYPTNRDALIQTENLYDLKYQSNTLLSGTYSVMRYNVTFLTDKYTEDGLFKNSIDFIMELLFNPNVKDNGFDVNSFEIVKEALRKQIISAKESPSRYSISRMLEESDKTSPISYNPNGYLEDLDKITNIDLYNYYKSVLTSDLIDIFVVSDIESNKLKDIFNENFKIKTIKKTTGSHLIHHDKIRKRVKVVKESSDNSQSQLVIGFKLDDLTPFERQYVMSVYSYMLGLGTDSKLFKIVREENSLCYSISANYYRTLNLFIINTGINKENYKKTLKLIKNVLKEVGKGQFSDDDICNAKTVYKGALNEAYDSPYSIVNVYLSKEYFNNDLVNEKIKNIDKVTKEMVVNISNKLHYDTIFLLEGDKTYE